MSTRVHVALDSMYIAEDKLILCVSGRVKRSFGFNEQIHATLDLVDFGAILLGFGSPG